MTAMTLCRTVSITCLTSVSRFPLIWPMAREASFLLLMDWVIAGVVVFFRWHVRARAEFR